jgi:hypothetical protein
LLTNDDACFCSDKLKKDNLVDRASSVQRGTQKRYSETLGYNWIGDDESMDLGVGTQNIRQLTPGVTVVNIPISKIKVFFP